MVHREWVTWPSGRSVKWFPTAYSSPTLWAERPHPFWGVFMGDIAGVHWRTINRVRCDYCIPSNRLHNSVLVRALLYKDKTVSRLSYLYNGHPFTQYLERQSLYWTKAQLVCKHLHSSSPSDQELQAVGVNVETREAAADAAAEAAAEADMEEANRPCWQV